MRTSRWVGVVLAALTIAIAAFWFFSSDEQTRPADNPSTITATVVDAGEAVAAAPIVVAQPEIDAGAEPGSPEEKMYPGDGTFVVTLTRAKVPVEGGEVRLYYQGLKPGWSRAGTARTGADGKAKLAAREGMYVISVHANGASLSFITLKSAEDEPSEVELELGPPLSVTGQVVDQRTQAPLVGAEVSVKPPGNIPLPKEELVRTRTDGEGRFSLGGLLPGPLQIAAEASGYDREQLEFEEDALPQQPVRLTLSALPRVRGTVRDAEGRPVEGAQVEATSLQQRTTTATSRAGGSFEIAADGEQVHLVARRGDQASTPQMISVPRGAAPEAVILVLQPAVAISGIVVRGTGKQPASGAVVTLRSADPSNATWPLASATTDARGQFALSAIGGRYTLDATHAGLCAFTTVEVSASPAGELRLVLPEPGWVEGTVVDTANHPVSEAVVKLSTPPIEGAWGCMQLEQTEVRTDARGAYRFDGVGPGEASLTAHLAAYSPGDWKQVTVSSGAGAKLNFTLEGLGVLRGTVKTKAGAVPAEGVEVMVTNGAGFGRGELVEPGGTFMVKVPAGEYSVVASYQGARPRRDWNEKLHRVNEGKETVVNLTVGDAPVRARLAGRVLGTDGEPAAAAVSWMYGRHGSEEHSGADGKFEIQADSEEGEGPAVFRVRAFDGTSASDELVVKDSSQQVTLRLKAGRRVEGRVLDVAGRAVSRFSLTLHVNEVRGSWPGPRDFEGDSFSFEMPRSKGQMVARLPDGRVGALELEAGEVDLHPVVRVAAGATIKLRALTQSGAPVAGATLSTYLQGGLQQSSAVAGPDGRASVGWLLPGRHSVTISTNDGRGEKAVVLEAGQVLDVGDVTLRAFPARPSSRSAPLEELE
jgi:protocatechuate 3,4-dioxygenase beta subunit